MRGAGRYRCHGHLPAVAPFGATALIWIVYAPLGSPDVAVKVKLCLPAVFVSVKSVVTVCPCDCFHEGEQMLYIDPDHCIDCEACVPECPVGAICHETAVPPQWQHYVALNAAASGTSS